MPDPKPDPKPDEDDDGLRGFIDALIDDDSLPDPRQPSPRRVRRSEALRVIGDFYDTADQVYAVMPEIAEKLEVSVACLDNCNYCCEQLVQVSVPEAEAIADWLSAPGRESVLAGFRARAHDWLIECGADALETLLATGEGRFDDAGQATTRIARSHQLCPLHDGTICTAYEVRPFVCRHLWVAETSEHCRGSEDGGDVQLISSAEHERFFAAAGRVCRGLQYGMGEELLFRALPIAVLAALDRLADDGDKPS